MNNKARRSNEKASERSAEEGAVAQEESHRGTSRSLVIPAVGQTFPRARSLAVRLRLEAIRVAAAAAVHKLLASLCVRVVEPTRDVIYAGAGVLGQRAGRCKNAQGTGSHVNRGTAMNEQWTSRKEMHTGCDKMPKRTTRWRTRNLDKFQQQKRHVHSGMFVQMCHDRISTQKSRHITSTVLMTERDRYWQHWVHGSSNEQTTPKSEEACQILQRCRQSQDKTGRNDWGFPW